MPDKPLTVLTYAASASLAAVALVYFFNPNYLIDGESSSSSASMRKKGVVGLFNPANDCFINCVLQSLAGLGDLRLFLIRETHRRELDGDDVYNTVPALDSAGKKIDPGKLISLQSGEVTKGLKEMIDRLNERPICRKTISASSFIRVLEHAFATRISKSQQDAQELLQLVAERLSEEYQAGKKARQSARELPSIQNGEGAQDGAAGDLVAGQSNGDRDQDLHPQDAEGFPLEGQTETRIECQFCHFIPKTKPTSFVMLTLAVPQKNSTNLNECFDGQFKREFIDDYKCDKCRLVHALDMIRKLLGREMPDESRASLESDAEKIQRAIADDPEKVPEGVKLPDMKSAPKRKIAKYVEITKFPKILIIHLSRSIYDQRSNSTKNLSKVSFPERFPIGGLLNRRNYKLLGVVSHKGTHNNGHYETFRRQHAYAPYSNPHLDSSVGPYSPQATPTPSATTTPVLQAKPSSPIQSTHLKPSDDLTAPDSSVSAHSSSPSRKSNFESPPSSRPSSGSDAATVAKTDPTVLPNKKSTSSEPPRTNLSTLSTSKQDNNRFKWKKKLVDRWWRISDDKIKECKTSDVLSMQKEVYMLFYEVEKEQSV